MKDLATPILETIAYFDIYDYPMTEFEIWKFFYNDKQIDEIVTLSDIRNNLNNNESLINKISYRDGYYFLNGRESSIDIRRQRYALAERKYMKAIRVIKIIRFFPFIKMVAVCNTLAFNNSRREVDIDLFIITKRNRVWQSRFWVTGFLKIFKMRPSGGNNQDTICSTFFVDEDNLDFEKLLLNDNDIYLKYWTRQAVPIYNEGIYEKFYDENKWIKKYLPNVLKIKTPPRRHIQNLNWLKMIINSLAFFLPESIFKKYQWKIMPQGLKDLSNKDSRVIVNDHMLKFHDNDRRQIFFDKWVSRKQEVL